MPRKRKRCCPGAVPGFANQGNPRSVPVQSSGSTIQVASRPQRLTASGAARNLEATVREGSSNEAGQAVVDDYESTGVKLGEAAFLDVDRYSGAAAVAELAAALVIRQVTP